MKKITPLLFIALLFSFNVIFSQTAVHPTLIKTASHFSISQPVRDMPVLSEEDFYNLEENEEFERNEELRERNYPNPDPLPNGIDPVLQSQLRTSTRAAYSVTVHNFDGQTSGSFPPDCNGSVGPNYFFEAYNTSFAIYDKNTEALVAGPTAYNTLFDGVTGADRNDGDPIILYDEQADRWLAAEFSLGSEKYMLIAVSVTNDPTGSWYRWSFDMGTTTPDYMKFGVWRDGYYMATNADGVEDVFAFERDVMLSGGSNPQMVGFDNPYRPNSGFHCIMPLDNDGDFAPAGTPGQFMTINDGAWQSGTSDQIWVYELNVDWNNTSNSTFDRVQQIDVPAFDSNFGSGWDNIAQPGTSQELDAIPQIFMYRVQYRNFGTSQNVVACHTVDVDGTDHAGIRWYELENTGSGWSIRQSGTYAPDAASRWIGSIAMNANHEIGLAYSISDADNNIYPGIRFTGQSASENASASGVMDIPETSAVEGGTYQASYNRWGDYAQMSVDPDDDLTFWYNSEYMQNSTSTKGTRIVAFKFQTDDAPSALQATAVSYNQIDLTWSQNSNNDPVLLAWSSDGTFGTPQDGQTYNPGDALPGGGTVLYYGSNTDFNHTGLTENTTYYYKAWSYKSDNTYSDGVTANATTPEAPVNSYPFTWDFEASSDYTQDFSPWTTYDGNGTETYSSSDADFTGEGTAFAYLAMNPVASGWTSAQGDTAHNGDRCGMSICPNDASQTDHWFISPALELGTNSSFSLWVLSPKPSNWGNESYEIMVSTTDNNPSSFTSISGTVDVPDTWTQHTYDLSAYDNQTVYIAIHHIATDKFMFWIDELEINSTTGSCVSPSITTQPVSSTICEGDNISFNVVADGTNLTYQWKFNGNNISGATSDTYSINNATATNAGDYTCYISNDCGNVTSNTASLTVNQNTAITQQPSDADVCEGENVSFSVTATGSNLTYQWKFNGNNISGATNNTLNLNNITSADAGDYTCVVTGDCGSITSNTASLTIGSGITINTQPTGGDFCDGDNVNLTVDATGSNLTYQWQFNGNNISGATSSTYTINGVTSADAGDYTCVITSDCGSLTSNTATITIGSGVTINTQPVGGSFCEGSNVNLTVDASGTNLTYQWQFNGNNISGATSSTYTINSLTSADAGDYNCVITSNCGNLTSNTATISLLNNVTITQQPQSATLCDGDNFTLTVTATGSNLTYQWKLNGNNISGATSSTYTGTVSSSTTGIYTCEVNSDCGSVTSDQADIELNVPEITQQPQSVDKCEGDDVVLSVVSSNNNDNYQWRFNNTNISGATQAYLVLNNVSSSDAGNYDVVVTNSCNSSITSDVAVLNVGAAPNITSQPVSLDANVGDSVIFTVVANGVNLTYQWNKNGVALSDGGNIYGSTTNTLSINGVTENDYGNYDCDITGDCGSVSSNIALLTVITSVDVLEKYGLVISPNPSNGTFSIRVNNNEAIDVKVISVNGEIIYQHHFENSQSNTIDLSSHAKGIYFIQIGIDEQIIKAKLIFK